MVSITLTESISVLDYDVRSSNEVISISIDEISGVGDNGVQFSTTDNMILNYNELLTLSDNLGEPYDRAYLLTVFNGVGSGWYMPWTIINISANMSDVYTFVSWTGDVAYIEDITYPDTRVFMPSVDVSVGFLAKYKKEIL